MYERLHSFYLKVVLVPVNVQFQNSCSYYQELDDKKSLEVIEQVMESHERSKEYEPSL